MKNAAGRKARDDRYYQANRDDINRRRRERRQRKKERAELGDSALRLVDLAPGHDRALDSNDVPNGGGALRERFDGGVSCHAWLDSPGLDFDSTDPGSSNSESSQIATADREKSGRVPTDCLVSDRGVSAPWVSERAASDHETSDFAAPDQCVTDQVATDRDAPDQCATDQVATDPDTPDQCVTDQVATDRDAPAINISYRSMERPHMENLHFPLNNIYSFPSQTAVQAKKEDVPSAKGPMVLVTFQLFVMLGLATLGIFLQVEFYKAHDVLPGFAWPLAIAGCAGMLSLATIKFEMRFIELFRKLVYCGFYFFMVLSSSFHVLSGAWIEASKVVETREGQPGVENSGAHEQALGAVTRALNVATQKGAWKVMESLGTALTKGPSEKLKAPAPRPFGISAVNMIGAGAVILIVLRALLEAAQALTAVAVRDHFLSGNKPK